MQYNTALGFVLCGLGIFAVCARRAWLSSLLGIGVALIGGITLAQYALGVSIGLDELFMSHYITVKTSHPGRMAPTTAFNYLLSGLAIALLTRSTLRLAPFVLGSVVTGLAGVSLMGYVSGVEVWYALGNLTGMAAHTAAGFLVIGGAILTLGWHETEHATSPPRVSPKAAIGVATLVVTVTVGLWQGLLVRERDTLHELEALRSELCSNLLEHDLELRITALERMRHRAELGTYADRALWESDARRYIQDLPGIRTIEWLDATGRVRWIVTDDDAGPVPEAFGNLAHDYADDLARAGMAGELAARGLASSARGESLHVAYTPILVDGKVDGFIAAMLDTRELIASVYDLISEDYAITVRDGEHELYMQGTPFTEDLQPRSAAGVDIAGLNWDVWVLATERLEREHAHWLPWITLTLGLLLACGLSGAVYAGQLASARARVVDEQRRRLEVFEERLRLAGQGAGLGVWDWTCDDNSLVWDEGMHRLFGTRPETFGGLIDDFWATLHPDDVERVRGEVGAELTDRKPFRTEYRVVHADGQVRHVATSGRSYLDDSGSPVRMLGVCWDVTEQVRGREAIEANEALEALHAELRARNEELDHFVYAASHDLKSPIVTILGYTSYMMRDIESGRTDELQDQATRIKRAAERMRENVDDLLELSRIGRAGHDPRWVPITRVVEEVLEFLRGEVDESGAEIATSFERPQVLADRAGLAQILQNLVHNAIQYGHGGQAPRIEIGTAAGDGETRVYVRDNGHGIPPEHHDRIFGLFQRLAVDKNGTGVGLALVRRIAEVHGARAWVESEPGRGATFLISFPDRQGDPAPTDQGARHDTDHEHASGAFSAG